MVGEVVVVVAATVVVGASGMVVLVEGSLDASSFIAYMGLAYNILTPAKAISKASYGVRKGNAAAERVLHILETDNPLKDPINGNRIENFRKQLKLENISFSYEQEPVLRNFDLTVPKGKTVALVGQSGSGKSTVFTMWIPAGSPWMEQISGWAPKLP